MVTGSEPDSPFSITEDDGVVVLRWSPGIEITGEAAAAAMAAVDKLNGDHKRPLLVDMTGTSRLARPARVAFQAECQVSRMAIVGRSPVDKVIAHFGMRVSAITMPSRYFTSIPSALAWLDRQATPGGDS
jgi:hypothetical protein